MQNKLEGIIVALSTPITEKESLDKQALEKLISHVLAGGVNGVFIMSGTGEFGHMLDSVWEESIEFAVDKVQKRVPVLAGVSDMGTERVKERVRRAQQYEIDGVVVTSSYFYGLSDPKSIMMHFTEIADFSKVPVVMYEHPGITGLSMGLTEILELQRHPNIVGIKDSSGDFARFHQLLMEKDPNFKVFQGSDALVGVSALCGGDGAIVGLANIMPRLLCDIYLAGKTGDLTVYKKHQKRLLKLIELVVRDGTITEQSYNAGIKAALKALGIGNGLLTKPFLTPSNEEIKAAGKILRELGLSVVED
ncbi:MAG: dihydrodipicolinate synthase family protein [Firmicutes bacterium]|nr:dihydrodipicolinate synthase family protein [Bacillota bacterium]